MLKPLYAEGIKDEIRELILKPRKIIVTTHRSPDGDAMGSSLGMVQYLRKLGHDAKLVVPNAYPAFLNWMKGQDWVVNHETQKAIAESLTAEADLIFCLDYNALQRMEKYGDFVGSIQVSKIMIDHHPQPDDFPIYRISEVSASSTSELVYSFIHMMGHDHLIDRDLAECLYAGIMTDTGNFRFPSCTARTHWIVASLMERGARNEYVYNEISDSSSLGKLRLTGYALYSKLEVFPEHQAALITLSREELEQFDFKKGDTEGLVNYGLSVSGVRFAALFMDSEGLIKVSLRSKGEFDVNRLSRKHFGGGGHKNAAGGRSTDETLSQMRDRFIHLLPTVWAEFGG